jgi:uncharacterized protein
MRDEPYWEMLGELYIDAEGAFQDEVLWKLFESQRRHKEQLMNQQEREFFAQLPDKFRIYRGFSLEACRRGLSWSLDYGVAKWFGDRYADEEGGDEGCVVRAWCDKRQAHALLMRRDEMEIVVHPTKLRRVERVDPPPRPDWLEQLWDVCREEFALGSRTHHGPSHWFKVEANGIHIASRVPSCDLDVVRAFAVLHDCKRTNEDDDPKHGPRAAAFCRRLHRDGDLPFSKSQLDALVHACTHHTRGTTSTDPTIGACWDADRLDLIRVGIVPAQKFFSTATAFDLRFRT